MPYTAQETRYEKMAYRRCGRSGIVLPELSLGLWNNFGAGFTRENCFNMMRTAFDHGICHFDLANNYGPPPRAAEETFGDILRRDFAPYRDELFISTKAGYRCGAGPYADFGSKKYLTASLDTSLRAMGLSYVDLFYHHRPDPDTPVEETAEALALMVRQGKTLYVGISSYKPEQTAAMAKALAAWNIRPLIHQPRYSLLDRWIEPELLSTLDGLGMGCIVYSPLAQGLLTGRYLNGIPADSRAGSGSPFLKPEQITPERVTKLRKLSDIAAARGQTLAQLALQWAMRDRRVTSAIIGASRPEQILDDLGAVNAPALEAGELAAIDQALLNW